MTERRFMSNYIIMRNRVYVQSIVTIENGVVKKIDEFKEETAHTRYLGGILVIGNLQTSEETHVKNIKSFILEDSVNIKERILDYMSVHGLNTEIGNRCAMLMIDAIAKSVLIMR